METFFGLTISTDPIKETFDKDIIQSELKSVTESFINTHRVQFQIIYAGVYYFKPKHLDQFVDMLIQQTKIYNMNSTIFTMISSRRNLLITHEKMDELSKGENQKINHLSVLLLRKVEIKSPVLFTMLLHPPEGFKHNRPTQKIV